jgi:hypothetical protein
MAQLGRRTKNRKIMFLIIFSWLAFSPMFFFNTTEAAQSVTQTAQQTNARPCMFRDPSKRKACLQAEAAKHKPVGVQIFERFVYNKSAPGHLNSMVEVKNNTTTTMSTTTTATTSYAEIYRTAHWIWFSDPTIYAQNKAYIDPLLNWPETSYVQISQWLGLTLPPGSFDGGRRAIYVDFNPGYFGWTSAGNIGIGYQVFGNVPDWPWVVIPHETANMFTGEGISGGWPTDWWADGRSPFPAMVGVQVEKAYNLQYWSAHDAADNQDPAYRMFRDELFGKYGWELFQNMFLLMRADAVNLANVNSEYQSPNWYSLHYLKSHTVAYYMSRAAGVDLSATLNQGSVGTPPPGWTSYTNYQIDLSMVIPTAQLQLITGVQRGKIMLTSTASDPDWGVRNQAFYWSTDGSTFTSLGTVPAGQSSITWDTTSAVPTVANQVWVASAAIDNSGFQSSMSISQPFIVDNSPPNSFDFTLSNSGPANVTQGNIGSSVVSVRLVKGSAQPVTLACTSGLPLGASCSFAPATNAPNYTSTLTVSASGITPAGVYAVNVTGTSGSISRQTQFALKVNPAAPAPPSFDFSISISSSNHTVTLGQSASYSLTLALVSGVSQPITLSLSGCPPTASCSFGSSSSPVIATLVVPTITAVPATPSILTVATNNSPLPAIYTMNVSATGGGVTHNAAISLTVIGQYVKAGYIQAGGAGLSDGYLMAQRFQQGPTSGTLLSISFWSLVSGNGEVAMYSDSGGSYPTPTNKLTTQQVVITAPNKWNNVTMASENRIILAAGTSYWIVYDMSQSAVFSHNGNGGQRSYFTPWTYGTTFPSTWPVGNSRYDSGYQAEIYWTSMISDSPQPFAFTISNSGNIAVTQGSSAINTIRVKADGGAPTSVSLSCSNLPVGVSCSLNPASGIPNYNSTLTVATSPSTPAGSYLISVAGNSGGVSKQTELTLTVNTLSPAFDFSVSVTPTTQNVTRGGPGSYSITLNLLSGSSQSITLTLAGCPSSAACSFSQASASPPFTSTLMVVTSNSTPSRSYVMTVTAAGGVTHTTTLSLGVTDPFVIALVNSGNLTLIQGYSAFNTITANLVSGLPQSISLTCDSGLPAGISCAFDVPSGLPTFVSNLRVSTLPTIPSGTYTIKVTATGGGISGSTQFTLTVYSQSHACAVSLTLDHVIVGSKQKSANLKVIANCPNGVGSSQIVLAIPSGVSTVGAATGTGFMLNPIALSSGTQYRWASLKANGQVSGNLTIPITIAAGIPSGSNLQITLDSLTSFKDTKGNSMGIVSTGPMSASVHVVYPATTQLVFQALDAYFQNKQCSTSNSTCLFPNRVPTVSDIYDLLDIYFGT